MFVGSLACSAWIGRTPDYPFKLENIPYVFGAMAELAAGNAGTEVELANGNAVVLDVIREVVVALGHGTNENCNTLALVKTTDVVADSYNFRIEA